MLSVGPCHGLSRFLDAGQLLLMHDHDGVDGPGVSLQPKRAVKELLLGCRLGMDAGNAEA